MVFTERPVICCYFEGFVLVRIKAGQFTVTLKVASLWCKEGCVL